MSFSFHAYQAELYPTRIRAQAVGFVYSWSRFSAIFSGFTIAFFLGRYGTLGVFGFIAGAISERLDTLKVTPLRKVVS